MRRIIIGFAVSFCLLMIISYTAATWMDEQGSRTVPATEKLNIDLDFGKIPLYFIPNRGQVSDEVLFYARTSRYMLWVTREELVFDQVFGLNDREKGKPLVEEAEASGRDVSRMVIIGGRKDVEVRAGDESGHIVNYIRGNDPDKWMVDIPTSLSILYQEIYPRIDLKVYGVEGFIEYDWIVKPGANPSVIRFEYKRVKETGVDGAGDLVVRTEFGEIMHHRPEVYQKIAGERVKVEAAFRRIGEAVYGIDVGKYDRSLELVIDPVLVYSSYLGGNGSDSGYGIAVDHRGCAYVTGITNSTNFPTFNPYSTEPGDGTIDTFVTKLSNEGNALVYSTYLGGSGTDYSYSIAVDNRGCAYITGFTDSPDFPTKKPFMTDPEDGMFDAFVTKLSNEGNALAYSTYLGGNNDDFGLSIAVDNRGCAYVTGETNSTNFPTSNPYMTDPGDGAADAFVTKLTTKGNALAYSTYLGGSLGDYGYSIAVNNRGCAYVTGETNSTNFPTSNPYMTDPGDGAEDAFVTKLAPQGNALAYSTYLGGSNNDYSLSIAVDNRGCAYVTGKTNSTDYPTKNPYMTDPGGGTWDAFVTKLSNEGNALAYSTYLGGSDYDYGRKLAVDNRGCAYITGFTDSTNFPTQKPFMTDPGDGTFDAFVTKLK